MKSAEEWMNEREQTTPCRALMLPTAIFNERDIRAIQGDALEAAAKVLEDDRKYSDAINYRPNTYQLADYIRDMKPKDKE